MDEKTLGAVIAAFLSAVAAVVRGEIRAKVVETRVERVEDKVAERDRLLMPRELCGEKMGSVKETTERLEGEIRGLRDDIKTEFASVKALINGGNQR